MKKLIVFGFALLLGAVSMVTATPVVLAAPFLPFLTPRAVVLGLSDVDVSAITSFAANNQKELIASLINNLDIASDIMVYPGVKNKIPMPKLKVGNGLRPYSPTQQFKSKQLTYTDRFLEVKASKRELQIDPEDYRGTYLSWVNSAGSGANQKDIPFAQFMWELVIKSMQREMNDETAYFGFDGSATAVFNAGTVYNPGDVVKFASATNNPNAVQDWYRCITLTTAGQSPDTTPAKWLYVTARAVCPGLESYILAGITATEISPVATGVINGTAGVALAAFNKMFRAWSTVYRNNGIIISCSQTDMDFLVDDILNTYSKYTRDDLAIAPYIYLPNSNRKCIVKVATWLGASRRLIAGPLMPGDPNGRHMNLFMGTDLLSDLSSLEVKTPELWMINAGIKSAIGFNYQDPNGIKVGDQS